MVQVLFLLAAVSAPPDPAVTTAWYSPKATALHYDACVDFVEAGGKAVLAVGVPAPPGAYSVDRLDDTKPGLYACFRQNGRAVFQPLVVPQKMEAPEPVQFFQPAGNCVGGRCPTPRGAFP